MKSRLFRTKSMIWALPTLIGMVVLNGYGLPVVGRTDTFTDGTTQGWGGSYPGYTPHPITIATDGPAGPNDSFLLISTNGFHLATRNQSRAWTGDYLSVGVKAIAMDLKQLSGNNHIRLQLALIGPGGMFASAERTESLLEQEDWIRHIFSLSAADLVHVDGGTGLLEDTLRQVTKVLIRHDGPKPSRPGGHPPHVVAAVGIDNITAILRDHDAGWTFGNRGAAAYRLDGIEPAHIALGILDVENPMLTLEIGKRYQVTITNAQFHPLEIIAKGAGPNDDEVLLSMKPGVTGALENDEAIDWQDAGTGTVAFTLTQQLWSSLQGGDGQFPGYRCGIHRASMRGDFVLE